MLVRFFFCMFLLCCLSTQTFAASASIDLREQGWTPGTIHQLSGEWDFYWQQFIAPEYLAKTRTFEDTPPVPFPVPGAWNSTPDGIKSFPGKGYGTYHITLFTPPDMQELFLAIPDMASAYKLYSNGRLVAKNGRIGTQKQDEVPAYQPKVVSILPDIEANKGRVELVLQTSNFHYQWGGPWYPLKLTDAAGVYELREKPIIQAMLSATILIAASLFGLFMFASRAKEKLLLYFSLLCLTMGLRRLLIDERILYFYFGDDWHSLQALENLCTYLAFPLFVSYFSQRFPVKYSQTVSRLSWLIAAPFCLLALTTEVAFYTQFNVPFQIIILLSLPYIFYTFIKVLRERRFGTSIFGLGLAIFIITVINDILTYSYVINTPNLAHLGILAFVIFQGIDLAKSYLHNFETIEDLSKTLQSQNRELIRIDTFKDEFLATTSHELRTPLHGISGLARHLLADPALQLDESQHHKLDLIASSSRRLSALVNDILDFESIKHGQLKLYQQAVDLQTLSDSVIATLKPLLLGRDIQLSAQIEADARWVEADENRLQQILFNLLGNAVKFTEAGFIQLNARLASSDPAHPQTQSVLIEISDTGMGIPEGKVDLLFEPFMAKSDHSETDFTQDTSNTESNYSGSGLGLSISRQLLRQHGSDLLISSKPGEGTQVQFSLSVPANKPTTEFNSTDEVIPSIKKQLSRTVQHPLEHNERPSPNNIEHALIFVVDDDEVNRELVKAQLEKNTYRVECFGGGHALLERLANRQPDLILLDLMMPMLNGLEVCQRIRRQLDSYELPIMMLTARYQVSDIVDCLSAGANDYLVKPYHETELLARVYSQLSARQFWISHQENQVLKQEIDQRKQLQAELTLANQRLVSALNIADESILLLNHEFTVVYANQAAEHLSGIHASALIMQPLSQILSTETVMRLQEPQSETSPAYAFEAFDAHLAQNLRFTLHPFQEKGEQYYALVISTMADNLEQNEAVDRSANLLQELTNELTRSRHKIDQIEQALKQVTTMPNSALSKQNSLSTSSEVIAAEGSDEESRQRSRRELLVKVLRESLILWESHTHQSKADLAEASRCWRVYLDGTTAKTRTLDRYLSERTLPEKPRWQLVVRTAKYVLDHCPLSADESMKLGQMIDALDQAFE